MHERQAKKQRLHDDDFQHFTGDLDVKNYLVWRWWWVVARVRAGDMLYQLVSYSFVVFSALLRNCENLCDHNFHGRSQELGILCRLRPLQIPSGFVNLVAVIVATG